MFILDWFVLTSSPLARSLICGFAIKTSDDSTGVELIF